MKITILAVGAVTGPLAPAVSHYLERSRHYWKLTVTEVDPSRGAGGGEDPVQIPEEEGVRLLSRIPEGTEVVALTRNGKGMTSRGLATYLGRHALHGGGVTFIVGGAYGLGSRILQASHRRLGLSPMTLPHELARLVLIEQIYRAGTLRRNEPYHKGPR